MLLLPMLLACRASALADETASPILVLDVAPAQYQPAPGATAHSNEVQACKAWTLDDKQVASLYRLSHELAEGELHDYDWLPCAISGHLQVNGLTWTFEINAAGTSTWRSGDRIRYLGCSQDACRSLVLLSP